MKKMRGTYKPREKKMFYVRQASKQKRFCPQEAAHPQNAVTILLGCRDVWADRN